MDRDSSFAAGVLLALAGVWLLLQTTVGDLPGRLIAWGRYQAAGGTVGPNS